MMVLVTRMHEDLVVTGCADVERKGGSYEVRRRGSRWGVWGGGFKGEEEKEGWCSLRITESGWGTSPGVNTLARMVKTGKSWGHLCIYAR